MKKELIKVTLAVSALMWALPASAENDYPTKPITLIVPYSPGGATDIRSRTIANRLGALLGTSVVVENRSGGGGNIGTSVIARARPDGYTIGIGNLAPMSVNKCLFRDSMNFDPEVDLAPIVLLEHGAPALAVNSKTPYMTVSDAVEAAKKSDGNFNFGSSGAGAASHLLGTLFQRSAGFQAAHIPYKGGAQALLGLMSGDIDYQIETSVLFLSQTKAENPAVRILAVATPTRVPALPDVPTFKESGYPDIVATNWFGLVAPAGTPRSILEKLNATLNQILSEPEYIRTVESQGALVAGGTADEFKELLNNERSRWCQLIEDAGISAGF